MGAVVLRHQSWSAGMLLSGGGKKEEETKQCFNPVHNFPPNTMYSMLNVLLCLEDLLLRTSPRWFAET